MGLGIEVAVGLGIATAFGFVIGVAMGVSIGLSIFATGGSVGDASTACGFASATADARSADSEGGADSATSSCLSGWVVSACAA
jgi:hypothetical protein